jgi:hypothetical protein
MESLARLVALLLALAFFTGQISLVLTSKIFWNYSIRSKPLWIFRRLIVATISPVGIIVACFFVFIDIPITPKVMAVVGLGLNVFALKREFFRN